MGKVELYSLDGPIFRATGFSKAYFSETVIQHISPFFFDSGIDSPYLLFQEVDNAFRYQKELEMKRELFKENLEFLRVFYAEVCMLGCLRHDYNISTSSHIDTKGAATVFMAICRREHSFVMHAGGLDSNTSISS